MSGELPLATLHRVVDTLPDAVFAFGADGHLIYLNGAAAEIYGRPLAELRAAEDFRNLGVSQDDLKRLMRDRQRLKPGRSIELGYTINRPDGSLQSVRERLTRERNRVQGTISPVRESDALDVPPAMRKSLDNSDTLFAAVDWQGRMRWLNEAWHTALGHTLDEMIGGQYIEQVHPEDRVATQSVEARRTEAVPPLVSFENRVRTADGRWRWIAWRGLPWWPRQRTYLVGIDVTEAKEAEARLARAEEMAAVARGATYDGLWDVDLITGEITCNARLYALLGYDEGEIELRYENWLQHVHADDRERVAAAFEDHLWGEAPMYHLEHRMLRKDGSPCWVLARGQVISRQGGFNPLRMVGSYTDVTERRRAQEALKASEERARLIVDAVTVPMIITRMTDGRVLFANDYARGRFGRQAETDRSVDFYAGVSEREGFLSLLETHGQTADFEMTFSEPRGTAWFIVSASLIEVDDDPAVLATFSEITARIEAEEAIRERNETMQLILATTTDGIWDWDLRTDAVTYSARWKAMLGYGADALRDHADTWRALIHPADRPIAESRLQAHLTGATAFEHTSRYRHRDGQLRWILVRGHAIRDGEGRPLRIVGTHTDITDQLKAQDERQQMENRLQNTQRLESMGVMAKGVAHDFNNLLMAIMGNAELAMLDVEPGSEAADTLIEITQAGKRASELCNQLMAYAGEGQLALDPLDLGSVTREMQQLLEATASRKARIEMACDDELPAIRGDAARLRQVIANMVLNASDALGGLPGRVRIETGMTDPSLETANPERVLVDALADGLYVYLQIEDDGCGMPAEMLPRIFDPFFTTRRGQGRGLGLAAALGIVRGHGGTIEVESSPGKGSRFRLLFPTVTEADRVGPGSETAALPQLTALEGDGRILLVDDEGPIREYGQKMLERAGFTVDTAVNGREAVEQFQHTSADVRVVVLDMTMPELDGEEVFRILRDIRPDVPVLLMSGFPEHAASRKVADDPSVDFLAKPFTRADLLGRLGRLLG